MHSEPMKIYGDRQSGNCYKVQLTCGLVKIKYQWIDIDILANETKSDRFLKLNPAGKIPLLLLNDGRTLSESNAIINYLAHNSPLIPQDPFQLAKVQQWQFFEQYSHEPYIAVARFIAFYLGIPDSRKDEYKARQTEGYKALAIMEQQLNESAFLTGSKITTADISLYAYTHVAHQGGFELDNYPAIRHWLQRIEALDGYTPMTILSTT